MKESNRATIRAAAAVWLTKTNRKKPSRSGHRPDGMHMSRHRIEFRPAEFERRVGRVIDPTECICPGTASKPDQPSAKRMHKPHQKAVLSVLMPLW